MNKNDACVYLILLIKTFTYKQGVQIKSIVFTLYSCICLLTITNT